MDINQAQLKQLVDSHLGVGTPGNKGETAYYCPFCNHHKKKLQVNFVLEKFHCWVCNTKGNSIASLMKKSNAAKHYIQKAIELGTRKFKSNQAEAQTAQLTLPEEYIPLWKASPNSPHFKNALHYLMNERGLTKYDILKYQIGYCESGEYSGMIIIPSYDEHGVLNFFTGRSYYVDAGRRHNNPDVSKDVIGFENLIDWSQPITIVEGAFDAISTKRNAIPLFGKMILTKLQIKIIEQKVKRINIALDPDALPKAVEAIESFINNGVDVRLVKLEKDPNDTGFVNMRPKVDEASAIDLFDLISLKMAI